MNVAVFQENLTRGLWFANPVSVFPYLMHIYIKGEAWHHEWRNLTRIECSEFKRSKNYWFLMLIIFI